MKVAIINDAGLIACKNIQDPVPRTGEVRIAVQAAGICGTDVAIATGTLPVPKPLVLGHEVAGIIDEVGADVEQFRVGQRVTTEINRFACGTCFFCQNGMTTQCTSRKVIGIDIDGGFAEFLITEERLLHEIPDELDFLPATFIEPLAAAVQTFQLMPLEVLDRTVVLLGPGKLGLLLLQVIKAKYPHVTTFVVGRSTYRRDLAAQLGADIVIDASEVDPVTRIRELTGGIGADVVIEATGAPEAVGTAIDACRARGKVSIKSTHGLPTPINLTDVVVREITIYSSRCGPFDAAIELLRNHEVDVRSLITAVYPLSQVTDAFDFIAQKRDYVKICIDTTQ